MSKDTQAGPSITTDIYAGFLFIDSYPINTIRPTFWTADALLNCVTYLYPVNAGTTASISHSGDRTIYGWQSCIAGKVTNLVLACQRISVEIPIETPRAYGAWTTVKVENLGASSMRKAIEFEVTNTFTSTFYDHRGLDLSGIQMASALKDKYPGSEIKQSWAAYNTRYLVRAGDGSKTPLGRISTFDLRLPDERLSPLELLARSLEPADAT